MRNAAKYFDEKHNRIIFEDELATPNFWDRKWNGENLKRFIENGRKDIFVAKYTRKFLTPTKKNKILEGGCGKGQFVYALQACGYDSYGIDYAEKTVQKILEVMPGLNVSLGDVREIGFKDNFFDGYWSLGVLEHFYDGYCEIVSEMQRVIKPGGYLFLTFPYMSPVRRMKAKLQKYPRIDNGEFNRERFYQFAFDYQSVKRDVENAGFVMVYKKRLDGIKGIKSEIPIIKPFMQNLYDSNNSLLIMVRSTLSQLLALFAGHSILLIFRKV